MEKKYDELAEAIITHMGGKDNIKNVTHCMTRLRFDVRDENKVDKEALKKIQGVLSVVVAGGQHQVVIGQTVGSVYEAVCRIGNFVSQVPIDENLDAPKKKLSLKDIGNNILNYLSGSFTQLIPILMVAGLFKALAAIIGPDMLGLITAESNLYILLDFLYDAGLYFMPIYLGYAAARKLGASPVLGMMMGGILIAPDFIAMAGTDIQFSVYGIPCRVNDYSSSVLPIILSVWVLFYVEKFFKKVVPEVLSSMLVPFLTMAVMTPISLCALAPLGSVLGEYISKALLALGDINGVLAVAVIAALWEFLIMTGMHMVLVLSAISVLVTNGSENVILVAGGLANMAAFGMAFGAFLRLRDKKEKSLAFGHFISGIVGGVTEPALYGIGLRFKRPFLGMVVGGFVGGIYAGLTHVAVYAMGATNFLGFVGFAAGGAANMRNGIISMIITFVVAAAVVYVSGFDKNDPLVRKA